MSRYLPDVPVLHTTSPSPPPPPLVPWQPVSDQCSCGTRRYSVSTVLFRSSEEDECQPNPCQNGGRCMAHYFGGGFDCECPMGFRGTTCQGQLNFSLPNFNCINGERNEWTALLPVGNNFVPSIVRWQGLWIRVCLVSNLARLRLKITSSPLKLRALSLGWDRLCFCDSNCSTKKKKETFVDKPKAHVSYRAIGFLSIWQLFWIHLLCQIGI